MSIFLFQHGKDFETKKNQFVSEDDYKKFHDAGYDAYVTGYVWLKLAHIASTIHYL